MHTLDEKIEISMRDKHEIYSDNCNDLTIAMSNWNAYSIL